jgi:hypothetical protein
MERASPPFGGPIATIGLLVMADRTARHAPPALRCHRADRAKRAGSFRRARSSVLQPAAPAERLQRFFDRKQLGGRPAGERSRGDHPREQAAAVASSGASNSTYPSASPNAYQQPCSVPPAPPRPTRAPGCPIRTSAMKGPGPAGLGAGVRVPGRYPPACSQICAAAETKHPGSNRRHSASLGQQLMRTPAWAWRRGLLAGPAGRRRWTSSGPGGTTCHLMRSCC